MMGSNGANLHFNSNFDIKELKVNNVLVRDDRLGYSGKMAHIYGSPHIESIKPEFS